MKTILVPTDFSATGLNTVRYALHIAQKVNAGIRLCTAIKVPAESALAAQVAWPLEDYESLKRNAEKEFEYLSKQLHDDDKLEADGHSYLPHIEHSIGVGDVTDYVRNLVEEYKINVVMMGMSAAGILSRLFLGSTSNDMIVKVNFPLLLVPAKARYSIIKKIAFATDLSDGDIEIIHSLCGLARYYNAEILLIHVINYDKEYVWDRKNIDHFLSDVSSKVDYPHIYYRDIQSTKVSGGLKWVIERGQTDMLAMVHRNRPFVNNFLNSSHTQQLAKQTDIPLLIFPNHYQGVLF